jgi:lactate dehydrogenase-like 2-hydroxyacid dehydrogenase
MIYYSSKTVFDTIYEKAKLFFIELNKILGVTNFVMHSEFKLDGDDLMPIEINSMRFGGMGLGNLVFHSLNVNPYTYFQNDTEPDWGNIWNKNESNIFAFFIAYNSENKSVMEYKPNTEKLKKQFTHVLLEQVFDYKKQLAFAIYCLKETNENIEKLLKIEFDDYFEQSLTFKKISIIDNCGLTSPEIEKISMLSQEPISIYNDFPETETQIIERIGDADCVLVSWQTMINADILKASTSLKFIGMCCSLYDENSANVDIAEARKLGIEVKGVKDYGDEGTVEFIFAQLIYLLKGLGKHQWKSEGTELSNKSIGIVGLGTLGQMVAKTAIHFGMNVFYFNRSRKHELEKEGITYLPLNELVKSCDIITTHLPKNTILLNALEFQNKKENSILVNTSLGLTFDKDAFLKWISNDKTSFAILDADGVGNFGREFSEYQNIITTDQFAGFTIEAKKRLSEKVLANLTNYLEHK